MKKILIATPALDQKVDCYYVHSLCESIKLGLKHDLDIRVVFLANESILPMARNELFSLAYHDDYDAMVFIDDDESWSAEYLINILQSDKPVVALPVVNKGDQRINYNVFFDTITDTDSVDGYIAVDRVGTGFLKLSYEVVAKLYENEQDAVFRGRVLKNICEYQVVNNEFVGEDISLCAKIRAHGYKIWVNPSHTVEHIGNKKFQGNFQKHLSIKQGK